MKRTYIQPLLKILNCFIYASRLSDEEKRSSRKGKKTATIKKPKLNYVEIDDSSEVETSEGQFEEELKTPSKGKVSCSILVLLVQIDELLLHIEI